MKSLDELNTSLLKMGVNLHKNNVILTGDFNAPGIKWNNLETRINLTAPSERLLDIVDEHDLNQLGECQ